ncbi:MAG: class I SAM-dependent methyltransferase [Longimicrobiales bacterium]
MKLWERLRQDVARQYYQGKKFLLRLRIGEQWEDQGGFTRRKYGDYETYVEHQKTKFSALRAKSIEGHDRRFHAALTERLAGMPLDFRGRNVLCIAARQGSEVRAFIDQGAFAVGIDLNPGRNNRYVVVGDFHALQYADASVDFVYTNSLDHAFDLGRIVTEVRRVLKPDGAFIVEANVSADEGAAPAGPYEAIVWAGADELLGFIAERGFRVENRATFRQPWAGEQFTLRATS